jgi:hypothetical protein
VLSHKDVILNRSLSQLSPQENHLEYHIDSTLTQRRTIHPSHGHTQHWGTTQLSHRGERCTPSHGHTQHWALSQVDSTQSQRRTYPGECHTTLQSSTVITLKSLPNSFEHFIKTLNFTSTDVNLKFGNLSTKLLQQDKRKKQLGSSSRNEDSNNQFQGQSQLS